MKKRIFIIDEAHELSSSAWAALLKPTEEPESHVMYIFCTSEVSKVPSTVASRFRRINFRPIPDSVIADYLSKLAGHMKVNLNKGIPECSPEVYGQIALVSGGNMRTALNYLESMFLVSNAGDRLGIDFARSFLGLVGRDVLYGLVDAVAEKKLGKALDIAISIDQTAPDYHQVCSELGNIFRNAMHWAAGLRDVVKVSDAERDLLSSVAEKMPVSRTSLFCFMFTSALRAFEVNSEKNWVLESLVARLIEEDKK